MVKLFFQVSHPFQTPPFQDNFGETPLIIFGLPLPQASPQAGLALTLPSFKSLHSLLFLSTAAMIGMMIMVVKMIDFRADNDDDMIKEVHLSHIVHAVLAAPYP